MTVNSFIAKWRASGASERGNYALFLADLATVLDVPPPDPATDTPEHDAYTIDRTVTLESGATNYVDLYRRGCFVLEAKQGSDAPEADERTALGLEATKRRRGTARRGTRGWETEMLKAKAQARRYAQALPAADGWPPFLVVCDVGYCFDLYADFSRQGKAYVPFPDQRSYRIMLEDLEREDVRETLRLVWTDPMALDPQRRAVVATRALARKLAALAKSMEDAGNAPGDVADFLMRCLFTMFAEDVRLLPERAFTDLLARFRSDTTNAPKALTSLWQSMKTGGFAGVLGTDVRHFNGHLFADSSAPALSEAQLELLAEAARADWTDVEPAIFGTLLEQALDPAERHRLGAHYTPRAYVERLVLPTIIEPLREQWEAVQAAATLKEDAGDETGARAEIEAFHRRLCSVRVLDPACGSGNFLYVTLEHLKRLEGEVTTALAQYPGQQTLDMTGGYTVSPSQLLGIELNERAAAIAEVVLWIGYLQWHFRTFGSADRLNAPLLRDYGNVEHRDAVLAETDDGAPAQAAWPAADYIVGNPPFVGSQRMRDVLGGDYTERLRTAYRGEVPGSADLVMFWWHKAAEAVRAGEAQRFGFITTNSLPQKHARAVVERHLAGSTQAKPASNIAPPLSLVFAVPDHPWTYDPGGASVRIAMTVGVRGEAEGRLAMVTNETPGDALGQSVEIREQVGRVRPDLSVGADVAGALPLKANADLAFMGVKLVQSREPGNPGFLVTDDEAAAIGLGTVEGLAKHLPPFKTGKDVTQRDRGLRVIDFHGLTAVEARSRFPDAYQRLLVHVKPFRDTNNRAIRRENWWLHGETIPAFRDAVAGLDRYLVTVETAKHRVFTFVDGDVLPDGSLIAIALDGFYHLGVLSGRAHVTWALRAGGVLEDRPRYNSTRTFQPFPFPAPTPEQQARITELGEALHVHREARRALHPALTLTEIYNVVEALQEGRALSSKEQQTFDAGAVGVLAEIHSDIDRAVAGAYGWPEGLTDDEMVSRLAHLNAERAAEEARGHVRYLRPAFQNPGAGDQTALDVSTVTTTASKKAAKTPWPKTTTERVVAVRQALSQFARPALAADVAALFTRVREPEVADVLAALDALGLVQRDAAGAYSA